MLVSPQSIEASLTARRLQRWGGQTCMVSDVDVARGPAARASLARDPDRSCAGTGRYRAARRSRAPSRHAAYRDVHAGDAARIAAVRHLRLHRLSGQAAARGFARRAPDGRAGSGRAEPGSRLIDPIETPAAPSAKGLSILVAEDNQINALLIRSLLGRLGHRHRHHHQRRRGAGILAVGEIRRHPL